MCTLPSQSNKYTVIAKLAVHNQQHQQCMRKHMHTGKHERDFYAHSNALDETCGDRRDVFDHTAVNLIRRWTEPANNYR